MPTYPPLPPAVVTRHAFLTVHRDVNDHRAVDFLRCHERIPQLFDVAGPEDVSSEALRVERKIDGQPPAVVMLGVVAERSICAIAITRAETRSEERRVGKGSAAR